MDRQLSEKIRRGQISPQDLMRAGRLDEMSVEQLQAAKLVSEERLKLSLCLARQTQEIKSAKFEGDYIPTYSAFRSLLLDLTPLLGVVRLLDRAITDSEVLIGRRNIAKWVSGAVSRAISALEPILPPDVAPNVLTLFKRAATASYNDPTAMADLGRAVIGVDLPDPMHPAIFAIWSYLRHLRRDQPFWAEKWGFHAAFAVISAAKALGIPRELPIQINELRRLLLDPRVIH